MLKSFGPVLAALLILACGGGALFYYAHADPPTEALDADLKSIEAKIKTANDASANYSGGLIKVMIELQKQVLQTTATMLEAKRAAVFRRIDLEYQVNGKPLAAVDNAGLKSIQQDIDRANSKLQADQAEADRFSGGLAQSMALVAVATDRTSLSQLYLAYYTKKYELAIPETSDPSAEGRAPPGAPGKVVKDKDAL